MNQVQTGLNLALRLLLRSPFVVFGAMLMAFTVDSRAALWFAAAIPVLSVVVFGIMLVSMPLYKKVQQLLDKRAGHYPRKPDGRARNPRLWQGSAGDGGFYPQKSRNSPPRRSTWAASRP